MGIFDQIKDDIIDAIKTGQESGTKAYDTEAKVVRTSGSTAWVHIPGGVDETPVKMTIHCEPGDNVQVRVAGGSAWLVGNETAPPTDDTTAIEARLESVEASLAAQKAMESAQDALASVQEQAAAMASAVVAINSDIENLQDQIDGNITTWYYAYAPTLSNEPASTWTTTEEKDNHIGDIFYNSETGYSYRFMLNGSNYEWVRISDEDISAALEAASVAQDTADHKRRVFIARPTVPYDKGDLWCVGASGDILTCTKAKTSSQSYAASDWSKLNKYTDDTVANAAAQAAASAQQSADSAAEAAQTAWNHADEANTVAQAAASAAESAQYSADSALQSASTANTAANSALTQLSVVEDVVDVLNWISEHGTYKATEDTKVVAGKYYFTRSGTSPNYTYTVVTNPAGNPKTKGYYELDGVDEAVSNYVSSHLALTNQGLWVVNDNSSYKILLASDGMKVYDASGNLVSTFGESVTFSSTRPQTIGNSSSYVKFYKDGSTWKIAISADAISLGNNAVATQSYADGKASTAETNAKNNTTNKLKSYYTKTQTDSAITQKANEIAVSVAETKIAEIDIGGRNLLLKTAEAHTSAGSTSGDVYIKSYVQSDYLASMELVANENVFTLAFDYEVVGNTDEKARMWPQFHGNAPTEANVIYSNTNRPGTSKVDMYVHDNPSGRYIVTFKVSSGQASGSYKNINRVRLNGATDGATIKVSNFKLELGNKATDWTPAPEDMESYTDNAVSTLRSSMTIAPEQIATEVAKKVGNDEVISRINQSAETVKIQASKVEIDGTAIFNDSDFKAAANAAYDAKGSADKANSREQLIYISKVANTTSIGANTTWVTNSTGNQNVWTTKRPEYSKDYPVLFVATQRQTVAQSSGTACTCTTPMIDDTITVIDGGKIITGTVTANQLDANSINASKILTVGSFQESEQANILNSNIAVPTVNLLPSIYYREYVSGKKWTSNGITFVVNNDGSVTASGTATADASYILNEYKDSYAVPIMHIDNSKNYTLSGCPSGGSSTTYCLIGCCRTDATSGSSSNNYYDYGNGRTFKPGTEWINFYIVIKKNYAIPEGGLTFYPQFEVGETANPYISTHQGSGALRDTIDNIYQQAESAAKTASNYIVADSTGLMVAELNGSGETPSTATTNNVLIDSDSVDVRDGQTVLATFGTETAIYTKNGTELAHFGYGSGNAETGTSVQPYYSIGKRPVATENYDASKTYTKGDVVLYNGAPYVCCEDITTAEAWNADHWLKANAGNWSVAEGYLTVASGYASHAEGQKTMAAGTDAHAEGYKTVASGSSAHAEGGTTKAIGPGSHAEGVDTVASNSHSHAEGYGTVASGNPSHAEGQTTVASGQGSHAEGLFTEASGYASHAEGEYTIASGRASHARGYRTHATRQYQTVIGYLNELTNTDGADDAGKYIFVIGNGSSETERSNAFTVGWGGGVVAKGNGTFLTHKMVYEAGDVVTCTGVFAGHLTTNKTQVQFFVPLPKPSAASLKVALSGSWTIRHSDGGYILNNAAFTSVGTITTADVYETGVYVVLTLTTASSFTNNCPVAVFGTPNAKITFST